MTNEKIGKICTQLKESKKRLEDRINNASRTFEYLNVDSKDLHEISRILETTKKKRSMVHSTPERTEFSFNFLRFYIDYQLLNLGTLFILVNTLYIVNLG